MSVLGLRVGPFEIVESAKIPEPGHWYYARRTGQTRRHPQEVLVRLLPPDATSTDRAALQRQFDTLRGLEDSRIPKAVALYEGMGALAIHAVRGTPLARVVHGRALDQIDMTPSTLLDIALEIAETLQHMHHTGTVHGHLSAENVILSADGKVWIFGVGQGPDAEPAAGWMAPERSRGKPASQATDQWSLAALCGALVVGQAPWPPADQSPSDTDAPTAMIEPVMSQWPALGRLLQRLLDSEPANRHANMHPVRQDLLALSRKAGGTSDRRDLGARLDLQRRADEEEEAISTLEDSTFKIDDAPSEEGVLEDLDPPDGNADPPSDIDLPVAATRPPEQTEEPGRGPHVALPSEEIPVVRPDVRGDVPTAQWSDDGSPALDSGTIEALSGTGQNMGGPGPKDKQATAADSDGSKETSPPRPPSPLSSNLSRPPKPSSPVVDEEDEEAATVLYGRDAIDKLLNATPSSAARAAEEEAEKTPSVTGPQTMGEEPMIQPTAVPATDSRDPSEELFRDEPMANAVPLPIDIQEPAMASGEAPLAGLDMPSGPAVGNPEEIAPPAELPARNLTAQRVATALVVVMGLAMAAYALSQLL
jgi:serine/threonine protein kinase